MKNRLRRGFFFCLLLLLSFITLYAQETGQQPQRDSTLARDIEKTKTGAHAKTGIFVLPLLYYTPDTRWAAGAFGVYYFRLSDKKDTSSTRLSYVKLLADYTQNRQLDIWSSWNIFLRDEAFLFKGEARYRIYPDRFYGIGNNTPESNREQYQYSYILFKLLSLKKLELPFLNKPVFIGPDIQYTNAHNLKYPPEGRLPLSGVTGARGGLNSGVGIVFLIDTRDNVVSASRGRYLEFSSYFFTPILGGDFKYQNINAIYNRYFKVFKNRFKDHVLASNLVMNLNFGDPPFVNLASAGNDDILRGYARYRYRDKHFIGFQGEYRFPIWWRFGGVFFAGLGDVFSAPRQVSLQTVKYSFGPGLRSTVNKEEKLNVRFDYGFGRKSQSFYLSLTEAF